MPGLTADFGRVIFLHHSVGADLIEQGDVRQRLLGLGYEFYDHGYNDDGLVLADGSQSGLNLDVPDDNTDPDGFADIFAQPLHPTAAGARIQRHRGHGEGARLRQLAGLRRIT